MIPVKTNKTQTGYLFQEMIKNGSSMEELLNVRPGMFDDRVIGFVSEHEDDIDVRHFLEQYYDNYRITDTKAIVISDTHLEGKEDEYRFLYSVYNYALRNNIRYILHGGDIIEGYCDSSYRGEPTIKQLDALRTNYERIYEIIRRYPLCRDIITMYILGNHDYLDTKDKYYDRYYPQYAVCDALKNIGNIHLIGSLKGYVKMGDMRILLHHSNQYGFVIPTLDYVVRLQGHGHSYYFNDRDRILGLPALKKDIKRGFCDPSFIVLSLEENELLAHKYSFLDSMEVVQNDEKRLVYKREI